MQFNINKLKLRYENKFNYLMYSNITKYYKLLICLSKNKNINLISLQSSIKNIDFC